MGEPTLQQGREDEHDGRGRAHAVRGARQTVHQRLHADALQ